ncbi:MAG TPA: hypothetical protein VGL17_06620 [Gemmatimonadaceae bacterium]
MVRKFETVLWDDHSTVISFLSRVRNIVEDAGYLTWNTGEQRPSGDGAPGTYDCYELDLDPRTGVRNYDFRVFEDGARPVIDRIIEALREPDDGPERTATVSHCATELRRGITRRFGRASAHRQA